MIGETSSSQSLCSGERASSVRKDVKEKKNIRKIMLSFFMITLLLLIAKSKLSCNLSARVSKIWIIQIIGNFFTPEVSIFSRNKWIQTGTKIA
jgi:hypothetical protein